MISLLVNAIFTVIASIVAYYLKKLITINERKQRSREREAEELIKRLSTLEEAVKATLYDRLLQSTGYFLKQENTNVVARQNIDRLYAAFLALGAEDILITEQVEKFRKLSLTGNGLG